MSRLVCAEIVGVLNLKCRTSVFLSAMDIGIAGEYKPSVSDPNSRSPSQTKIKGHITVVS